MELIAHAHGLVKVDAIDADQQRTMTRHHLGADVRNHVRTMRHIAAKYLVWHILMLKIRALPTARSESRGKQNIRAGLLLRLMESTQQRVLLSSGRSLRSVQILAVTLPPSPRSVRTENVEFAATLQPRQRNAALNPLFIAEPSDHRKVAGRNMQHGISWLLDPDANLKRGRAHQVHSRPQNHIAVLIGHIPHS